MGGQQFQRVIPGAAGAGSLIRLYGRLFPTLLTNGQQDGGFRKKGESYSPMAQQT